MRILVSLLLMALLCSCTDPKKVPELTQQLSSSKSSVRNKAALELARIGAPYANPAVPSLISLLSDPNKGVQSSAAYALRKIDTVQARKALDNARQFKD